MHINQRTNMWNCWMLYPCVWCWYIQKDSKGHWRGNNPLHLQKKWFTSTILTGLDVHNAVVLLEAVKQSCKWPRNSASCYNLYNTTRNKLTQMFNLPNHLNTHTQTHMKRSRMKMDEIHVIMTTTWRLQLLTSSIVQQPFTSHVGCAVHLFATSQDPQTQATRVLMLHSGLHLSTVCDTC